ncbi:MAG TPA: alpha/beta fold hydrolase [Polyangia bacterium]|jgi:pimeloyl-ACP methyl ester carboxylesterase|nr:alpha/beta fold hydrolase [Polyangia bacterium]
MALEHRIRHFRTAQLALLSLVVLAAACNSRIPARVEIIDGRQVEIATAGSGGAATVVFEAGLCDDWTRWDEVASEISHHTRVFAYSRPGYGASGPATTPRDPNTIVEELRALLASQGYAPPYVLVGHSNGGGYMELFAKSHADEVVGVVLVEPRHRDFLRACEAAGLDLCGIPESTLTMQAPSIIAEYHAYSMASDEIHVAGGFGSYPVRVLTASDVSGSAARQALWKSMHAALAAEATDGEQILVQDTDHYIQVHQPREVVQAILAVLPATSP